MKDKLLQAEGEELKQLLGEVLTTGPYHHKINSRGICDKCDFDDRNPHNGYDANCPVADPIPLSDWNVAKKYWGWAVAEYDELICDRAVYDVAWKAQAITKRYMKYRWFSDEAQIKHYLIAAALCKLESEVK